MFCLFSSVQKVLAGWPARFVLTFLLASLIANCCLTKQKVLFFSFFQTKRDKKLNLLLCNTLVMTT